MNQEARKITIGQTLSWIFGVIFVLLGIVVVVSEPVRGILFLIMGLIFLPPFTLVLREKFNLTLSRSMRIMLGLTLLFLALLSPAWRAASEITNEHEQLNPPAPTTPLSEEDQIKALVESILAGKTNVNSGNRLRSVKVVLQVDGGWGVSVDFNANENLTLKLTKRGIEKDMSDIYTALFTSGKDIKRASIAAYLPITDQYGNTDSSLVYKSRIESSVASKANWNTDKTTLELEILPGLWETIFLNQSFR